MTSATPCHTQHKDICRNSGVYCLDQKILRSKLEKNCSLITKKRMPFTKKQLLDN